MLLAAARYGFDFENVVEGKDEKTYIHKELKPKLIPSLLTATSPMKKR